MRGTTVDKEDKPDMIKEGPSHKSLGFLFFHLDIIILLIS